MSCDPAFTISAWLARGAGEPNLQLLTEGSGKRGCPNEPAQLGPDEVTEDETQFAAMHESGDGPGCV
jgi:hypothetical protein